MNAVTPQPLHRSLGLTLIQQANREAGAREIAEADRLTKRASDAQASTFAVSVGEQLARAGNYAAAIARFREALALADDNPQAHYQLALALRKTGATAEARRHFATANKLAPYLRAPAEDNP